MKGMHILISLYSLVLKIIVLIGFMLSHVLKNMMCLLIILLVLLGHDYGYFV